MGRLISNVVKYRHVLNNFVSRDLKIKYRGTFFGYLWSLLEPLSLVAIYYFIFVVVARRGESDYALLVILGVLPWIFFSSVITGSATALRTNAALVRRVQLPREIYIVAVAASSFTILLLSMIVVIPFLFIYDVEIGFSLLLWPVAVILMSMMAIGVGFIASCINVIYRDVGYLLSVVLRMGLYGSAVIFPVTMVPNETFRYYLLFNPLATCVAMARNSVLNRPMPFETIHVVVAAGFALVCLIAGVLLFPRLERKAVKFL